VGTTCGALILSRWNLHIFPRAETAISYAFLFSELDESGCLITEFKLTTAASAIVLNLDWANSAQTPIPFAASCRKKERLAASKILWAETD
jgi:hypothetical protein